MNGHDAHQLHVECITIFEDEEKALSFVIAYAMLKAVLHSRLMMEQHGVLLHPYEGHHTTLLVYASKGIPIPVLLTIPYIREGFNSMGLAAFYTIILTDTRNQGHLHALAHDWLYKQMSLQCGFHPEHPWNASEIESRLHKFTALASIITNYIFKEYQDSTPTIQILDEALNSTTSAISSTYAGVSTVFSIADHLLLFETHYYYLTGGMSPFISGHWTVDDRAAVVSAVHVFLTTTTDPQYPDDPHRYMMYASIDSYNPP